MNPVKGGWRGATAPSIIREIKEVEGGEQVPQNGSLALPKDVEVKPLSLKGFFNSTLNVLVPILTRGSNGLLILNYRQFKSSKGKVNNEHRLFTPNTCWNNHPHPKRIGGSYNLWGNFSLVAWKIYSYKIRCHYFWPRLIALHKNIVPIELKIKTQPCEITQTSFGFLFW